MDSNFEIQAENLELLEDGEEAMSPQLKLESFDLKAQIQESFHKKKQNQV